MRRPGALRSPPINAFQKHRKLRSRQANRTFGGLRPDKSSSFKTLGKQTQAVSVPPQELHNVASAAPKNEDVSGERLLVQHGLYLRTEPIKVG